MSKDVILERYGRLYQIPYQLARLGHKVRGYCLSYHGHGEGEWVHDAGPGRLQWESRSFSGFNVAGLASYPNRVLKRLRAFSPDIVIGASDIPHLVLGARLAKRLDRPFVADLYDNFESFGQARIPGMVTLLRRSVKGADLVLTTSEPLRELVIDVYQARGEIVAMPSAVDKAVFHRRDRVECRRELGLPLGAMLVGTAGGLRVDRGIGTLYEAWDAIRVERKELCLVLAGAPDKRCPPPTGEQSYYLGQLSHERTAKLFSALDVGVIYLRDTKFGRYCFPQKAYEMMACGLPIVATSVGVMPYLLADRPQSLYREDDPDDFLRALTAALDGKASNYPPIDDWAGVVGRVESYLVALTRGNGARLSS